MIWFSSDWHTGHRNIIKYVNRPFKDTDEMDAAIHKNMVSKMGKGDTLYYLGDLQWRNDFGLYIMGELKKQGVTIFFIRGNHDNRLSNNKILQVATWVGEYKEIRMGHGNGQKIVASHYPFRTWNSREHGTWHVYGHVHSTKPPAWEVGQMHDVGVDRNNFMPVSYDKLKDIMRFKENR